MIVFCWLLLPVSCMPPEPDFGSGDKLITGCREQIFIKITNITENRYAIEILLHFDTSDYAIKNFFLDGRHIVTPGKADLIIPISKCNYKLYFLYPRDWETNDCAYPETRHQTEFIRLYDLLDTTSATLESSGDTEALHLTYERGGNDSLSITTTYHLIVTDSLVGAMQKDYSLMERYPEFYYQ